MPYLSNATSVAVKAQSGTSAWCKTIVTCYTKQCSYNSFLNK